MKINQIPSVSINQLNLSNKSTLICIQFNVGKEKYILIQNYH